MAYDETLADRVRDRLADLPGVTDKRMFGSLAFLTDGRLTVGVTGDDLMVRVGAEAADQALTQPGTRLMEMGGRRMRGWIRVDGAELDDDVLTAWLERARAFVATLPPGK
ncbi:TfoX/Sxy family protein [Actinoplanes sp. NPDC049599]|jgi:TfoX/Sxy family transcriptional regulator of competence genes|uniref:TfoX/Sxy family protein n=1 Tax=Actinoplanes sp. NPDC049599 TaxID=3363903 RepID=UPI00378895E0